MDELKGYPYESFFAGDDNYNSGTPNNFPVIRAINHKRGVTLGNPRPSLGELQKPETPSYDDTPGQEISKRGSSSFESLNRFRTRSSRWGLVTSGIDLPAFKHAPARSRSRGRNNSVTSQTNPTLPRKRSVSRSARHPDSGAMDSSAPYPVLPLKITKSHEADPTVPPVPTLPEQFKKFTFAPSAPATSRETKLPPLTTRMSKVSTGSKKPDSAIDININSPRDNSPVDVVFGSVQSSKSSLTSSRPSNSTGSIDAASTRPAQPQLKSRLQSVPSIEAIALLTPNHPEAARILSNHVHYTKSCDESAGLHKSMREAPVEKRRLFGNFMHICRKGDAAMDRFLARRKSCRCDKKSKNNMKERSEALKSSNDQAVLLHTARQDQLRRNSDERIKQQKRELKQLNKQTRKNKKNTKSLQQVIVELPPWHVRLRNKLRRKYRGPVIKSAERKRVEQRIAEIYAQPPQEAATATTMHTRLPAPSTQLPLSMILHAPPQLRISYMFGTDSSDESGDDESE